MLKKKSDIDLIINNLSIDDKLSLLVGGKGFSSKGIEELNITELSMCDSHNGINLMQKMVDIIQLVIKNISGSDANLEKDKIISYLFEIGKALGGPEGMSFLLRGEITDEQYESMCEETREFARVFVKVLPEILPGNACPIAYPVGMNLAQSWDKKLMFETGKYVGEEANAYKIDMLLAPTINILRDPLCGRWFESYSEDPFVVSSLVVPYIDGVQSNGVLTCVKHFACNNQETNRHEIDEIISERALREIYLPGFKSACEVSKTMMTAYNSVNGEFCSQNNHLLKDILRDDWGYEGLVISDWNGVYDKCSALKAGNNLEMPGPNSQDEIKKALENGTITMDCIDNNVKQVLIAVTESNNFNQNYLDTFDYKEHCKKSYEIACDTIVLLKNDGILPLNKSEHLSVYGEYSKKTLSCGEGSSGIISAYIVSVLEGLENKMDNVTFHDETEEGDKTLLMTIGERVGEGTDRKSMEILPAQIEQLEKLIKLKKENDCKLIVLLNTPGPVEISKWIKDIDALLFIGFAGQEVGHAVADILINNVNPNAKLAFTYPKKYRDTPTYLSFPGENLKATYGEDIFVGYRYYDAKDIDTLYCFGYGLSYSEIKYKTIMTSSKSIDLEVDETLKIIIELENVSDIDAKEIVQLYLQDDKSELRRPLKELKGFKKISIGSHNLAKLEIVLDRKAFQYYDASLKSWINEPGDFTILVGPNSQDIKLQTTVSVICINPYSVSLSTSIKEIMKDVELLEKIKKVLPEGVFELPGIQIELIYHPELSIGECLEDYMGKAFSLSQTEVENYKDDVLELLSKGDN